MSDAGQGVTPTPDERSRRSTHAIEFMKYEAELVWSRYNAMLTANSLIGIVLGALFTKEGLTRTDRKMILLSSLFGVVLSILWYRLTKHGWDLSHLWMKEAGQNTLSGTRSPMAVYDDWVKKNNDVDRIRRCAQWVIVLFIVAYAAIAVSTVCALVCHGRCSVG